MPPTDLSEFLRQLGALSLAEWRKAAERWSRLEEGSYDRADHSALFALQQLDMGDFAADLENEISRVVNSMRFFARDGASVRQAELEAMRAAALTAGFGFLARAELDAEEFNLLTSPFRGMIDMDTGRPPDY